MSRILDCKFFVVIIAVFCMSVSAFAQAEKAEAEISAMMERMDVAGLAVAVVKDGDIVYTESFGLKDVPSKTSLSGNDIFRIASISKSFSATSIMQLVEGGKLSLNDDFSNLVGFKVRNPRFPETVITLKMVMSHTSSINDSQGYFNLDVINPDKNPDWAKCYNDYAPGTGYEYCNLNYNMVGAIIEKFSGERFDNYVKNHVLDPLGLYGGYNVNTLDSTRFVTLHQYNAKTKSLTPSPSAYAPRRKEISQYVMGYSTPVFSPTGGMKISATDLAKYMSMHMNYGKYEGVRIISKKSARLMQTPIADEEEYGLALRSANDNLIPGENLKGHTGSAYGLYSAMFFEPKKKFGIVVITNGCNPTYTNGFNDVVTAAMNSLYANMIRPAGQ